MRRLRIVVLLVVGVLIVTIVSATSAFAIPSEDEFPPGQGPSFNAQQGGLKTAEAKTRTNSKGAGAFVVRKLQDKASPS